MTNSSGTVVGTFDQDSWGNSLSSTSDSVPNGGFLYRWIGALGVRYDSDTELYYMRQRWYDPGLGRFISRDPLRKKSNAYLYSRSNPVSLTDPTGMDPWWQDPRANPPAPSGPLQIVKGVPSNAVLYVSNDGNLFWAPPEESPQQVFQTGQQNGWNPLQVSNCLGHFGQFDVQRDGYQFIPAYTDASNYNVGLYMNGAGYDWLNTYGIANTFASGYSSNAGSSAQWTWWWQGWNDARNQTFATPIGSASNLYSGGPAPATGGPVGAPELGPGVPSGSLPSA
ncbi:MAG: RHS repeat-associated core domain-containing protein [Candidatus Xenobia bacterium]